MSMTLPYRTDAGDILRLIDALARGRSLDQAQTLNFSRKAFEGTATAAQALGFLSDELSELTDLGRRVALAAERERKAAMLEAMLNYEPYGLLLEAIAVRGEAATPTDWIEAWWSTHGYGSSTSNRGEGSTALAKLLEYVELGSYLQGRRGHPSRIEWRPGALASLGRSADVDSGPAPSQASGEPTRNEPRPPSVVDRDRGGREGTELHLALDGGRSVRIQIPTVVSASEKERILGLLELLIVPTNDVVPERQEPRRDTEMT